MKKLMIIIILAIPFTLISQNTQGISIGSDKVFNEAYADLGNYYSDSEFSRSGSSNSKKTLNDPSFNDLSNVSDLMLIDPDFDIQENMVTYTKDKRTVFFSANRKIKVTNLNLAESKIKKSVQLQLFKAKVTESGKWVNLEMLPFNGKRHSTGHPSLNEDDSKLYFVSDGPESMGKTDIFSVDLLEDGTYGKPMNLGSKINSDQREVFPFVGEGNILFFESDVETDGNVLFVYASLLEADEPSTPMKLNVSRSDSRDGYVEAFEALEIEGMLLSNEDTNFAKEDLKLAEELEDQRDKEIMIEAENEAKLASIKEVFEEETSLKTYDFSSEKVIYTIQIGAFLETMDNKSYGSSSDSFNHQYSDGYNRFYSGVFESIEEANIHLQKMRQSGYVDAFILGLKGNERFFPGQD